MEVKTVDEFIKKWMSMERQLLNKKVMEEDMRQVMTRDARLLEHVLEAYRQGYDAANDVLKASFDDAINNLTGGPAIAQFKEGYTTAMKVLQQSYDTVIKSAGLSLEVKEKLSAKGPHLSDN
jgi:hypothetical protein